MITKDTMNRNRKILIVEDDRQVTKMMKLLLSKEGYDIDTSTNGHDALEMFNNERPDLVITDVKMPMMNGLDLARRLLAISKDVPIIIVTAFGTVKDAVEAIKLGASNYITKPISTQELKLTVKKVFEKQELVTELYTLRKELKKNYRLGDIIGKHHHMQELYDLILTISSTNSNVLITGETGTGKELVARSIHFSGPRQKNHFVPIAALPESILESELFGYEKGAFTGAIKCKIGKFEFANGGTIFFDEIGDIPLTTQVKLLRIIQERKFERLGGNETISIDVRIIAATHKDLEKMIEEGKFREDLYYRLNVIPIKIPFLRERKEDIPLLIEHFVRKYSMANDKKIKTLSQDVLNSIISYDWPGNVRELQNIIERLVVMARNDEITTADLIKTPLVTPNSNINTVVNDSNEMLDIDLKEFTDNCEKEYIKTILTKNKGRIETSADCLKVGTKTLYRKMKKYNIKKDDFRESEDLHKNI